MKNRLAPMVVTSCILIAMSAFTCRNMVLSSDPVSLDENQCEGILAQVNRGEVQLVVTVTPESASHLPDVLSTEEVVRWLIEGKLTAEKKPQNKMPWQPPGNCHIIYENHPYICGHLPYPPYDIYCDDWHWVCVSGSGSGTRCPCGDVNISAPVMN
jgi:hypothetical protein